MTIAFRSIGTVGTGTTSVTPGLPASLATGDGVLIFVETKPDTATPQTPANWTLVADVAGGGGTTGASVGPTRQTVYFREKTAAWSTMPTVTVTNGNATAAAAVAYSKAAGTTWATAAATGTYGSAAATTNGASTLGSNPGLTAGDWCVVGYSSMVDTPTWSGQGVSATGVTAFGTVQERSEVIETTTGNDVGGMVFDRPVTTGTATAAPTVNATASIATRGTVALVRLREVAPAVLGRSTTDAAPAVDATEPFLVPAGQYGSSFNVPDQPLGAAGEFIPTNPVASELQIVNGQVAAGTTPAAAAARYATAVPGAQRSRVQLALAINFGPTVCMPAFAANVGHGAAGTWYLFRRTGANVEIAQKNETLNTYTVLASTPGTPLVTDYLDLTWDETTLRGYVNDVEVISHAPAAPITGQNYIGFALTTSPAALTPIGNNWTGGPLAAANVSLDRAAGDTAGASDATARAVVLSRSQVAGAAAALDTLARAVAVARTRTDTAPATDAAARVTTAGRTPSDTAPAADSAAAAVARNITRTTSDTAPATDATVRTRTGSRATSDTAPTADAVTRGLARFSTSSEAAPAVDSTARGAAIRARATTDDADTTDTTARVLQAARSLTDSAPATDTTARSLIRGRATTDTAPAGDATGGRVTAARASTDFSPAVDSVARLARLARTRTDAAPATDATLMGRGVGRSTTDAAPGVLSGVRSVRVAGTTQDEAEALDGAPTAAVAHSRTTLDTASAVDSAARRVTASRSGADTAPASDTTTRSRADGRATTDAAPVVDSTVAATGAVIHRGSSDTAPATDATTRGTALQRAAGDRAAGADTTARRVWAARAVTDTAATSDLIAQAHGYARTLLDAAPAVDTLDAVADVSPLRDITVTTGPTLHWTVIPGTTAASTRTGPGPSASTPTHSTRGSRTGPVASDSPLRHTVTGPHT